MNARRIVTNRRDCFFRGVLARCYPVLLLVFVANPMHARAEQLQVAVAANFTPPFKEITEAFEKATGHKILLSTGSSGKFYAQIKNGAPFEVFLSADDERPKLLEDEGLAVKGSRFTYALGRLVLWSPDPTLVKGEETLRTGKFSHLAMANPKTAPYGAAALEVMMKLGVWEQVQARVVQGENIGQTMGFIESGNAELGFVALSQTLTPSLNGKGSHWKVPATLHTSIAQDVVLLTKGEGSTVAKALMEFMRSPQARAIIERYGYELK